MKPSRTKARTIHARTYSGETVEVAVLEERAGLGVTQAIWPPDRFTVSHLATGLDFANRRAWEEKLTYSQEEASELLAQLAPLADWERMTYEDLRQLAADDARAEPMRRVLEAARAKAAQGGAT